MYNMIQAWKSRMFHARISCQLGIFYGIIPSSEYAWDMLVIGIWNACITHVCLTRSMYDFSPPMLHVLLSSHCLPLVISFRCHGHTLIKYVFFMYRDYVCRNQGSCLEKQISNFLIESECLLCEAEFNEVLIHW